MVVLVWTEILKVHDHSLFSDHNTQKLNLLVKQQNVENNLKTVEKSDQICMDMQNSPVEIFKVQEIKLN